MIITASLRRWDANTTRIIGENRMNVQYLIETGSNYQGVTMDERMALRHAFDNKEDDLIVPEHFIDIILPNGPLK